MAASGIVFTSTVPAAVPSLFQRLNEVWPSLSGAKNSVPLTFVKLPSSPNGAGTDWTATVPAGVPSLSQSVELTEKNSRSFTPVRLSGVPGRFASSFVPAVVPSLR